MATNSTSAQSMESAPALCEDLIYDVGMHRGEDTDFYLQKGFRVVAFEANPQLVAACTARFAQAIAEGRLVIVAGAIVPAADAAAGDEKVKFYRSTGVSAWGTAYAAWAERNEQLGVASQVIEVERVDFARCIREHGVPYYMKIDVEGADRHCLEALLTVPRRPSYISIEAEKVSFARFQEDLALLAGLGYGEFALVQQENIELQIPPAPSREGAFIPYRFEPGSSGLFGRELPATWSSVRDIEHAARRIFLLYRLFGDRAILRRIRGGRKLIGTMQRILRRPIPGWYDIHARLAPGAAAPAITRLPA